MSKEKIKQAKKIINEGNTRYQELERRRIKALEFFYSDVDIEEKRKWINEYNNIIRELKKYV